MIPHASSKQLPKEDFVAIWRKIIQGDSKSWVMFEHGSCLILMEPKDDLTTQAKEIMRKWGPVHAGSPAGDFSVISMTEHPGWVVTGHHPDMLNYVNPSEISGAINDAKIGLLGRSRRDKDAKSLNIVHIEDKRGAK